jgi:ubiquitin-conjugating enzyme E2 variant
MSCAAQPIDLREFETMALGRGERAGRQPHGNVAPDCERTTAADVIALLVLGALLAPFAWRIGVAVAAGGHGVPLLLALLLGILAADLITGVLHWFADTFFSAHTPLIGPALIEPFREHHREPLAMTRRSFLRGSHANVLATTALLLAVWVWRLVAVPAPSLFADAWLTSLSIALWLTNQFHKWAHVSRVPAPVRWLQAAGLILTPARHARHHAACHDGGFCVTTGWLNPLLDRLQTFRTAERLIRAIQRKFDPGTTG